MTKGPPVAGLSRFSGDVYAPPPRSIAGVSRPSTPEPIVTLSAPHRVDVKAVVGLAVAAAVGPCEGVMDRQDAGPIAKLPWVGRGADLVSGAAPAGRVVLSGGHTGRVLSVLKALRIVVAYAVTVGVVGGVLVLTADDHATPWIALLAAMAVVHLGFGILVARWSTVLLPLVISLVGVAANLGDFSILTLLVGVPCAMLMVGGVALRIGWDGGPEAGPVAQLRRERQRAASGAPGADEDWDPVQPQVWDDAVA
jgi:hypothetical protein